MNRIAAIKKELKNINNRIESLMDKADDIKAIRELKGYSRAIMKCNDIEAKQLIKVYDDMDKLELKEDQLHLELKQLRNEEYSKECIAAHNDFKEYKYRVNIKEGGNNKIIYTNNIEEYKNIKDKNITILEYIDYNNMLSHKCNMPVLRIIYTYNIDYKYIVDFLNSKADTNYKHTTGKTQSLIRARMNEGFTLEDFKQVISNKCNDWKGTDFEKYLRPETLFGTKFESYLNSKTKNNNKEDIRKAFMIGDIL